MPELSTTRRLVAVIAPAMNSNRLAT